MTIKIKVTEERNCCEERDLVMYRGEFGHFSPSASLRFCKHCGQLWWDDPMGEVAEGKYINPTKVHPGDAHR